MTANGGSQKSAELVGIRFGEVSTKMTDDLHIVVSLQAPGEQVFTVLLNSAGVRSDFEIPEDFFLPSNWAARIEDSITLARKHKRKDVLHVVDLPEGQELHIGQLPPTVNLEIFIVRDVGDDFFITNRVKVVIDKDELQLFQAREFSPESTAPVVGTEDDTLDLDINVANEELESQPQVDVDDSVDIDMPLAQDIDVMDETKTQVDELPFEPPSLADVTESNSNGGDIEAGELSAARSFKLDLYRVEEFYSTQLSKLKSKSFDISPKNKRKLSSVAVGILISLVVLVVTPLGILHPTTPSKAHGNLVVVWSSGEPAIHSRVAVAVSESDVFVGSIDSIAKDQMTLSSGTDFAQAPLDSYLGRVLITIPLLGYLF